MDESTPLGLIPKYIRDVERIHEIVDAMQRFVRAGRAIPKEWIEELMELHNNNK